MCGKEAAATASMAGLDFGCPVVIEISELEMEFIIVNYALWLQVTE
jgi:hypothetical protein